ncbi:MAG: twin-arginine translocation signal domain-containing protein [Bacteroidales bacterium]|nr:twin-arginine translocation signal domain-containing protein [Bacteroidales bacterium]
MMNTQSRRNFLKISAAGAIGLTALGSFTLKPDASSRKKFGVGLQLYTIRDAMTADALGTLKKFPIWAIRTLNLLIIQMGSFINMLQKSLRKLYLILG